MRSQAIHAEIAKALLWKLALATLSIIAASRIFESLESPRKRTIFRENFFGKSYGNTT
jgi:hypothetical protein